MVVAHWIKSSDRLSSIESHVKTRGGKVDLIVIVCCKGERDSGRAVIDCYAAQRRFYSPANIPVRES
jgi:hypothetical protein